MFDRSFESTRVEAVPNNGSNTHIMNVFFHICKPDIELSISQHLLVVSNPEGRNATITDKESIFCTEKFVISFSKAIHCCKAWDVRLKRKLLNICYKAQANGSIRNKFFPL